jgi:heme/copper-type cytochrome/quinol oxidase subunit 3
VTLALPPAPAPNRTRSNFIGMAYACAAGVMYFGGLLGVYAKQRHLAGGTTAAWLPKKLVMPEVPSNTMLVTIVMACVTAQWAVWATKRGNRRDATIALALTGMFGVAMVNAQAFIYSQMKLPVHAETPFNVLFYVLTGSFMVAVMIGLGISLLTAFRSLGGRFSPTDTQSVSAFALYWYFLTAVFAAVWFFVYVTK